MSSRFALNVAPLLLVFVLVSGVGCKRQVEIRQDTPQAAVASLIKLYAAGDAARLVTLVEPTLTRAQARDFACTVAILRSADCMTQILEHFNTRTEMPESCKGTVSDCTCGTEGSAAAAKAPDFLASDYHEGLQHVGFSPERCSIEDVEDLDAKGVEGVHAGFWDGVCKDIARTDPFASVAVSCRGVADPMVFILHKDGPSWKVVGLGSKTEDRLRDALEAARAAGAASIRNKELNKDLK